MITVRSVDTVYPIKEVVNARIVVNHTENECDLNVSN